MSPTSHSLLDQIIVRLNTSPEINPNFRLWLTTLPNNEMPSSVLGDSIKLAIEPSNIMRDNILESFTKSIIANPSYYESYPNKAANFTKLIYSLVFLVAQCNGRQSYGREGWSCNFHIQITDLETALSFLSIIMKNHDGINFQALHYLIKECNIMNLILDQQDIKLFQITLDQVRSELDCFIILKSFSFSDLQ